MVSGNLEVFPVATREYAPFIGELWNDAAFQATYNRRHELEMLPRIATYFLEWAVEILRTDYEPSDMDSFCKSKFFSVNKRNARETFRQITNLLIFLWEIRDMTSNLPDSGSSVDAGELGLCCEPILYPVPGLATGLDVFPLSTVDMSNEAMDLVELIIRQARKAAFDPDPKDKKAVKDLMHILNHFKEGNPPDPIEIRRILDHLGIHEWSSCIAFAGSSGKNRDISRTTMAGSLAEGAIKILAGFLFNELVNGSGEEMNKKAFESQVLTKTSIFHRLYLVESDTIPHLLNMLLSEDLNTQENSIASLLNLSKHSKGKGVIVDNGGKQSFDR
ncbi:Detected protein of unknown function [Hibiscus syriacus]|uniref:Uncharacterized protein n=1 Tax=Hibiscus syriacus TaxID=106335 RepID=A0A6A2Z9V8_HIBSY|nr:Detected protein of unknown function [Hibiscus syriacus]